MPKGKGSGAADDSVHHAVPHEPASEEEPEKQPTGKEPHDPSTSEDTNHHSKDTNIPTDGRSLSLGKDPSQPSSSAGAAPSAGTPATAAAAAGPSIPDILVFRKDPDRDDFGFKAVWEGLTNPMTYHYCRYALRSALFVCFPLFTLAVHPNTMFRLLFPNLLIASIVSFSTHRPTLGEQIGLHSWIWRGLAYEVVLCSAAHSFGIAHHVGAWYAYIALGIFIASLVKHTLMRRFFYLYFFLCISLLRMQLHFLGAIPDHTVGYFTANHYIGSLLGMAALLFPYPVLTKKFVDAIITKLFTGLAMMVMGMETYIASPDVHAAEILFNDMSPFEKIEGGLAVMPPMLWFVNWEPLEFPLRNPIRRLKLALMRRLLALTYAAFECGRAIIHLKKQIADQRTMMQIRREMMTIAGRTDTEMGEEEVKARREEEQQRDPAAAQKRAQAEADKAGMETLKQNTQEHVKAFAGTLMQCIKLVGSTESRPEELVKHVPFDALTEKETLMRRNFRMELLQVMYLQRQHVAQHQEQQKKNAPQPASPKKGESSPKTKTDGPTGDAQDARDAAPATPLPPLGSDKTQDHSVRYGASTGWGYTSSDEEIRRVLDYQETLDGMEVYLTLNLIFFHMIIGMIANEVRSFGDMMKDYRPPKSLCQRLFEFFIKEPWFDFWQGLWEQVTFATPQHVRILKDAIKMVCAYLSACALNYEIWIPDGGLYFFGVTTLLGLPVEEESVNICICRMAGNTLGCAVGYLCYHNTNGLPQLIASSLCFAFFFRCLQHHPTVGQAFFYGSVITLAGVVTSLVTMELLTRVVAGVYSVGAYTLCCMLVFPTNPAKVLWGYRMKLVKVMSELMDDIAAVTRVPVKVIGGNETAVVAPFGTNEELTDARDREPAADTEGGAGNRNSGFNEHTKSALSTSVRLQYLGYYGGDPANALCSRLNIQLRLLNNMLALSAKWTPFASAYPYIRGLAKFPTAASGHVLLCHQRLVAHMELLVFSVQLLHRPRDEAVSPRVQRMLLGPFASLLDAFADAVRLLAQDFIDSLQKPRTFVYPVYLSHVSHLSRIRARLHAISYECYVFLSELSSGSAHGMTPEDYDAIRAERERRKNESLVGVQVEGDEPEIKRRATSHLSNTSNLHELRGNPSMHSSRAPAQVQDASEHPADDPFSNPQDYVDANASFADRFLLRQQLDGSLRNTGVLPSPTGSARHDADGNEAADGEESAREGAGNLSMTATRSFARRAYRSQAPLHEAKEEPEGCYPLAPEDPERTLREDLRKQAQQQASQRMEHAAPTDDYPAPSKGTNPSADRTGQADDLDHHEELPPVAPKRTQSALNRAVSNLIQPSAAQAAPALPTYHGPNFNYREDALESPADTDFMALVGILSSCNSIIADMERVAPSVNEVSGYQKQLHETTLVLPLLDKMSAKVKAYRQANYDRYHYPPPLPEKRSHLNAQDDMWREWRF